MDIAYMQHSPYSRKSSRSSTNLNHLTLVPLTSRLPLSDEDALPDHSHHISYIEGRSAPTTPSILSRSSSRVSMKKSLNAGFPKSKSSIHLTSAQQPRPGTTTPGSSTPKLRRGVTREDLSLSTLSPSDRNDSDWLLRAGTTISSSTRESKGQAWLVSRASSTNLTAEQDEDEEALQRELASRRESRRGSTAISFDLDADDEFSPIHTRRSLSFGPGSGPGSRYGSRSNSRRGSRAHVFTPGARLDAEGYFDQDPEVAVQPDFVGVEDDAEENFEDEKNDEDVVRKLARANSLGFGGWVEKMLGWSLFAVDEDGEEPDAEIPDDQDTEPPLSPATTRRREDAFPHAVESVPPPKDEDAGGWQDAAWLLSVAAKVIL